MGVRRNFSRAKSRKVEILLIFFRLLAMQHKWTYTKKKKALVFCSEHGYFKTVLAEFQMNHKKS